jgi:hypothetical protein
MKTPQRNMAKVKEWPPRPAIKRDASGKWIKGQSGNSLGRPRTALSELCRQEVTKHGLIAALGHIAAGTGEFKKCTNIPLTVADRIQAIRLLLLYGYGVPKQPDVEGPVKIEVTYPDNRQVNIANAASEPIQNSRPSKTMSGSVLRPTVGQDDVGD